MKMKKKNKIKEFKKKKNISIFLARLQWLDPSVKKLNRIGRLVGDQERNKSNYISSSFDINSKEAGK